MSSPTINPSIQTLYPTINSSGSLSPSTSTSTAAGNYYAASTIYSTNSAKLNAQCLKYSQQSQAYNDLSKKYSNKSEKYDRLYKEYNKNIEASLEIIQTHKSVVFQVNNSALNCRNIVVLLGSSALLSCIIEAVSPYKSAYIAGVILLSSCIPFLSIKRDGEDSALWADQRIHFNQGEIKVYKKMARKCAETKSIHLKKSNDYNQLAIEFAEKAKKCLVDAEENYNQATLEFTNGKDTIEDLEKSQRFDFCNDVD